MTNPPIQRHRSLQPFSRDHYNGLAQARHLVLSADQEPTQRRTALQRFVRCWLEEIAGHFTDEERLLLPLIPNERDADRLRREHMVLRELADAAKERQFDEPIDPAWLRHLGRTLHDHIRWEERELFGAIERAATERSLRALEQETAIIEAKRDRAGACALRNE